MSQTNPSKNNFFIGIISGIAIMAVIAFFVMFFLYMKNDTKTLKVANQNNNSVGQQANGSDTVDIQITSADHMRGNPKGKVVIVEYSDFQCPYCQAFHSTLNKIMDEYGDQVLWVYRHFPLDSIHPMARLSAEASECANEQGKFWEMADALFANQNSLSESKLSEIAGDIGLNTSSFESCLKSSKYADTVDADYQKGVQSGVRGTPGNFINGQAASGAIPYDQLKQMIESLL